MRRDLKFFTKLFIVSLVTVSLFGCNKKAEETVDITEVDTQESYRVITISTIEGTVYVKHSDGQVISAYEGMNLYDGDTVIVGEDSNIVVDADSDKHMLAEAGTRFWLTAEGTEEHNNTKINLEKGSVLCQITEKLEDGESFDVVTASSTMCVRGTVFRVSNIDGSDDSKFDLVEVYNGKVWSSINDTKEEVTLEPGQCALIKDKTEDAPASYISSNQIDAAQWTTGDRAIVLNEEIGDGNNVLSIAYNKLPSSVVNQLIDMSNEGQELCLDKDKLNEISQTVTERENSNTSNVDNDASTKLLVSVPGTVEYENRSRLNDHLCAEYGHVIITLNGVRKCAYCGLVFSSDYVETEKDIEHAKDFEENTGISLVQNYDLCEGCTVNEQGGITKSFGDGLGIGVKQNNKDDSNSNNPLDDNKNTKDSNDDKQNTNNPKNETPAKKEDNIVDDPEEKSGIPDGGNTDSNDDNKNQKDQGGEQNDEGGGSESPTDTPVVPSSSETPVVSPVSGTTVGGNVN